MVKVLVTQDLVKTCADYSYGSHRGDSNYIGWLDLNNDGRIDAKDVGALAARVGQTINVPPDFQIDYENTWHFEGRCEAYNVRYLDWPRDLPTDQQIYDAVKNALDAQLGAKMGEMNLKDPSINARVISYSVVTENRKIASRQSKDWTIDTYQVYVTWDFNFTTAKPISASPIAAIVVWLILGIILAVGVDIALYIATRNLTQTTSTVSSQYKITNPSPNDVVVKVPVINADGTITYMDTTVPAGGTLEYTGTESVQKPASDITQMIGYAILGVSVIGAIAIFVPMLTKKHNGNGNRRKR